MKGERLIFFEGIGFIAFRKKYNVKRMTIRIKSIDEITLTLPAFYSYLQAEIFVNKKKEWIIRTIAKLKEKTGGPVIFTDLSEFSTRRHILKIERTEDKMTSYIVTNDSITVSLPFTEDILSRTNQEKIKNGIISALRIEAKSILPDRLNELAQMHGFKYSAMQVKNMKSRWGSCTGRNKINLNLHLIRLPDSLIDYVLLHELAHTVHKNHSDEFWNYLGKFCEEPKKRARELKSYKTEI